MKVLVTGGCGFIGSNFIRLLLTSRPDWSVINVDKLTYAGNLENLSDVCDCGCYDFVRADIAEGSLMEELVGEGRDFVLRIKSFIHLFLTSHRGYLDREGGGGILPGRYKRRPLSEC